MGLHYSWFFIWGSFFFGLSEFLHQSHGFHFQSTGESTSGSSVDNLHQLLTGQIKQLVEINTSEHKLPEGSLLLQLHLGSFVGHLVCWFLSCMSIHGKQKQTKRTTTFFQYCNADS